MAGKYENEIKVAAHKDCSGNYLEPLLRVE